MKMAASHLLIVQLRWVLHFRVAILGFLHQWHILEKLIRSVFRDVPRAGSTATKPEQMEKVSVAEMLTHASYRLAFIMNSSMHLTT